MKNLATIIRALRGAEAAISITMEYRLPNAVSGFACIQLIDCVDSGTWFYLLISMS